MPNAMVMEVVHALQAVPPVAYPLRSRPTADCTARNEYHQQEKKHQQEGQNGQLHQLYGGSPGSAQCTGEVGRVAYETNTFTR